MSELNRYHADESCCLDTFEACGYERILCAIKDSQLGWAFGTTAFRHVRTPHAVVRAYVLDLRVASPVDANRVPVIETSSHVLVGYHGTFCAESPGPVDAELAVLSSMLQNSLKPMVVVGDANTLANMVYPHAPHNHVEDLHTFACWPSNSIPADAVLWFRAHAPEDLIADTEKDHRCLSRLDAVYASDSCAVAVSVLHPVTFEAFNSKEQQREFARGSTAPVEMISDHFPLLVTVGIRAAEEACCPWAWACDDGSGGDDGKEGEEEEEKPKNDLSMQE